MTSEDDERPIRSEQGWAYYRQQRRAMHKLIGVLMIAIPVVMLILFFAWMFHNIEPLNALSTAKHDRWTGITYSCSSSAASQWRGNDNGQVNLARLVRA